MQRFVEEPFGIAHFHDLPGVHDGHIVGEFAGGGDIVRDQDKAGAQFFFDALQYIENIGLSQNIQRGGRFIQDDQVGRCDQRHGNCHALTHAAA